MRITKVFPHKGFFSRRFSLTKVFPHEGVPSRRFFTFLQKYHFAKVPSRNPLMPRPQSRNPRHESFSSRKPFLTKVFPHEGFSSRMFFLTKVFLTKVFPYEGFSPGIHTFRVLLGISVKGPRWIRNTRG